jgi:hypothetical protein
MKLHDILKVEDNNYFFYRQDNTDKFYFKTDKLICTIPQKSYIRDIEHKIKPNGLEDVIINCLYDFTFSFEETISENWVKVK